MKKQILFNYPFNNDNLYVETYCKALRKISEKYNIEYTEFPVWDLQLKLIETTDPIIYILPHHQHHNKSHFDKIKKRMPNSKIILLGSDLIYSEKENPINWEIDLLIEATGIVVRKLSSYFPVKHIYWNISKTTIEEIKKRQFKNEKKHDLICLCACNSDKKDRYELFEKIKKNFSFLYNLNQYDFPAVCQLYNSCWFALGTTTSALSYNNLRSMKGMRDSIAPFCNTLLLADDYWDVWNLLKDPEMMYRDFDKLIDKINLYKNNLDKYEEKIEKQKEIFEKYNMDNQLENIFQIHKFI